PPILQVPADTGVSVPVPFSDAATPHSSVRHGCEPIRYSGAPLLHEYHPTAHSQMLQLLHHTATKHPAKNPPISEDRDRWVAAADRFLRLPGLHLPDSTVGRPH